MIDSVFNLLFRCRHAQLSRPMTIMDAGGGGSSSYLVCLDCGARISYDPGTMRVGRRMQARQDTESGENTRTMLRAG